MPWGFSPVSKIAFVLVVQVWSDLFVVHVCGIIPVTICRNIFKFLSVSCCCQSVDCIVSHHKRRLCNSTDECAIFNSCFDDRTSVETNTDNVTVCCVRTKNVQVCVSCKNTFCGNLVGTEDSDAWLGEGYACGAVGEAVADLERAGKRHAVITGVVEGGDPAVQAEIEDWCKAAQVRRRFRDTNIAQIGRPYPGMMDLYIDETNLYNRMFLYTKQFDWEKMWAIADDITDEEAIRAKAQDILDTFDIEDGGTIEKVWDMAKYVVAFEKWVKDEHLSMVASHYDGFAQGKAGVLDSMLIPAFSMLIKQGTACAVEGDMKVAMAMSILKTISGTGQLSEMYSIDFNDDICIIGHSGSGDADISDKKPTMKIVPVFHGKTGGGYLTQFYPYTGPVTYLAITQDKDGHFKFVVAEGVNEEGPILSFGDTNMRTRFTCGAREFVNRWSEAGPTHHMAAATGRHIDTILKVAKIFNIPVDIVTR